MGGKTSTSTQGVTIPPAVLAQYQAVNSRADATANTPFQNYTGQFVAPVNAEQSTGIANTNATAEEAQPYYSAAKGALNTAQANTTGANNAALGLAGASAEAVNADPLTGQQIDSYLSPYLNTVLGSTASLLNQNNQQQQAGQLGTAISSGAFGGDRTGIAAANLEQQQNLANANIYSGIANQGYENALSTAQQQQGVNLSAAQANRAALANAGSEVAGIEQTAYGEGANTASELGSLGSGAQAAGLSGANAQIGAGTVQQQTQQAQDAALYNQFLQKQSYPFQVDQFLANIAEGTGALSGSTTTTTQPGGFFSDRRLKHDIKKIGKTYDGQAIYSYKMHGDPRTHIGLIAQKVEKKHPHAVGLAAGYKTVDYGKATEEAANRGHFYEGGVVPLRHAVGYDGGGTVGYGDLDAILAAQRQMYQGVAGGNRQIPNQGSSGHQLTVASGSPTPAPSGSSQLSQSMGLINQGRNLYKGFSGPSAPATTPPGGGVSGVGADSFDGVSAAASPVAAPTAAPAYGLGAADVGAPAADAAASAAPTASIAAPAAADAAGAAAAGAGTAAAGAAADAGVDTAAALAAEYAAADAGVALAFAKRGGTIKRRGKFGDGGIPYENAVSGAPYSDSGGSMDIPDVTNTNKLQSAGALKKQPTGLQTLMSMGDPSQASGIMGSLFSNGALRRGGVAGRIGKDEGGALDADPSQDPDMLAQQTVTPTPLYQDTEGPPAPVAYTGGLNPSPAPAVDASAPASVPVDTSSGVAGGGGGDKADKSWLDKIKGSALAKPENLVPVLNAIAAMGTAPTKHLGVALAAGLGAGASSYLPAQAQSIKNQGAQLGLNAARDALSPDQGSSSSSSSSSSSGATPYSGVGAGPVPTDPSEQPAYYLRKYATPPMTQQEAVGLEHAKIASGFLNNPGIQKAAETRIQQRIDTQTFQNQLAAKAEHDEMYQKAVSMPDGPEKDALVSKINAIHPVITGDQYVDNAGQRINPRTGAPPIGQATQTLTPQQYQQAYASGIDEANKPVTLGNGLPGRQWQLNGFPSADAYARARIPSFASPQGAPPSAPATPVTPAPRAPTSIAAPPPAAASAKEPPMLPGVDIGSIPKLKGPPPVTDQTSQENAKGVNDANRKIVNDSLNDYKDQVKTAARNNALYEQLEKKLQAADPREFGPSSTTYKALANLKTYLSGIPPDGLVNQTEVDKFLNQLGVGGSKQLMGDSPIRQQELLTLMARANPNIDQPLQVQKNLVAYGKAGNTFDMLSGNTAIAAIRSGADPMYVPGTVESGRSDFIAKQLGTSVSVPARPGQQASGTPITKVIGGVTYTQRNGKWYAD